MLKKVTSEVKKVTDFELSDAVLYKQTAQMTNKIKLLFWYRKSSKDHKTGTIMLRVTLNNERLEFGTTNIQCKQKDWNAETQRLKPQHPQQSHANLLLSQIETDVSAIYLNFELKKKKLSVRMLKAIWKGELNLNPTFKDIYEKFLQERTDLCRTSITSYKNKSAKFFMFCDHIKMNDIECGDITPKLMNRCHLWLKQNNYSEVYSGKVRQIIKTILRWASEHELIEKSNLYDYVVKMPRKRKRDKLTTDEINLIATTEFRSSLQEVADCFIFATQTGLEYSGLKKLRFDSDIIFIQEVQKWCLAAERLKTGVERFVPLSEMALNIIDKYRHQNKLPVKSNKYMNEALKYVGMQTGIEKPLYTHLARKIFAHECINIRGMSFEATAKAMGQKDLRSLEFYAEVDKSRVLNEFFK